MASLRLDEQDIPVFISGEYMTATAWHCSIAVGGAKVQVPLKFVERAMQILDLAVEDSRGTTSRPLGTLSSLQIGRCPQRSYRPADCGGRPARCDVHAISDRGSSRVDRCLGVMDDTLSNVRRVRTTSGEATRADSR